MPSPRRDTNTKESTEPIRPGTRGILISGLMGLWGAIVVGAFAAMGLSIALTMVASALSAAAIGAVLSLVFLDRPWQEREDRLEQYVKRLKSFRIEERDQSFDMLKLSGDDAAASLSHEVHRMATEAYAYFCEVARFRRGFDQAVESETKKATFRLGRMAHTDELTGLGNRRELQRIIEAAIKRAQTKDIDVVCMAIDIDHFKIVNDTLGHEEGDRLLVHLADVLRSAIRQGDHAFRMGGDEFVVLFIDVDFENMPPVAERILKRFAQFQCEGLGDRPRPQLSIGAVSWKRERTVNGTDLLYLADAALYEVKNRGKGHANLKGLRDSAA